MSPLAETSKYRGADTDEDGPNGSRAAEIRRITDQVSKHVHVTFDETKAASREQTEALLSRLEELKRNPEKIDDWEADNFISWSVKEMASAIKTSEDLKGSLDTSVSNSWISTASRDKWIKRFQDSGVEFKKKEYGQPLFFPDALVPAGVR